MKIIFNGNEHELPDSTTITGLLESVELNDRPVAVEVNREVVPREQHSEHVLQEGDELEVVSLVGGG